jgi:hypothetical protein
MGSLFDIAAHKAACQHGRVTRKQLLEAGIDHNKIRRWIADGRLRRVHRGVFAVGHTAPSVRADYMAAVLACGEGAVLSHWAAAYVMHLVRGTPPPGVVTVPTTACRRRPGIVIHRVKTLPVLDGALVDNIPITAVTRILLDLAPGTSPSRLARLCHEAWVRHDVTPRMVEACIGRNPRKPGAAKLRRALGTDVTLSMLERGFLKLLAQHKLPAPRTNIDHHGDKVDCHWPRLDLTIELLSFRYHATRSGFDNDVARRRRSGHVAYTYGDVFERGPATIADLRPRLAGVTARAAPPPPAPAPPC